GFGAFLLFQCAFGVVGYFLFTGNSRAVLVLFAALASAIALIFMLKDPVTSWHRRIDRMQIFVWASMWGLAVVATNMTGWIARWVNNRRAGPPMGEAKETARLAKRESTLAYRLGKWVGHRWSRSRREK